MAKFMVAVNGRNWRFLKDEADRRNVPIQELLRVLIIPDWLDRQQANKAPAPLEPVTHPC
jgi:hypothetical protein